MSDTGKVEKDILERELLGRLLQKVINKEGLEGWLLLEKTIIEEINRTGRVTVSECKSGVKAFSPNLPAHSPRGRVLLLLEIARIVGV